MKNRLTSALRFSSGLITPLAAFALLSVTGTAFSVEQTWTAGNGTWTTGANGWNGNTTWTAGDTATFGAAGTVVVQVGGAVTTGLGNTTVGGLNFTNSGYTIQSDNATLTRTITMGSVNAAGNVTIASGVTATIGDRVKLTKSGTGGQLDLFGGGTLVVGSGSVGGNASLDTTNGANSSFINGNSTLEIKTGGTATYGTSLGLGQAVGGGTVNITGGDLKIAATSSNLILQNLMGVTASSSITISSGNITFTNVANTGGIRFGQASTNALTNASGTFNLDGGTVTANKVFVGGNMTGGAKYTAIFNFNGGTLKALGNQTAFMEGITAATTNSSLSGAYVKAGGAKIDSNGFNITIGQPLVHETGLLTADGGLEKLGAGTLTLNGTSTYNGTTTITAGSLKLGAAERIADSSNVSAAAGTTFNANGFSETVGTLLLTGSATLDLGAGGSNTLSFANSSALDWSSFTLTVSNWSGTNFLRFGSDSTGLTAGQLANINFTGFGTGAAIDASGFVTAIPEPGTWIMVGIGLTFLLYRRRSSRPSDKDF